MKNEPNHSDGGTFHYDKNGNLLKHDAPSKPRSDVQSPPAVPKASKPAAANKNPAPTAKSKAPVASAKPAAPAAADAGGANT